MDASNGPPADSRLITAPTVAPPPGVRPMAQPVFPQSLAPQLGLHAGFRPAQFAPAGGSGIPLFQAQAQPVVAQSMGSRKSSLDRSKGASVAAANRKQCNCKNSRCLKLYCECFASGRYCENCNCIQCYNNREHEATRQSAVEAILERNPNAFRPKIQSNEQTAAAAAAVVNSAGAPGRHLKGCNCKKSFCLKKYCECFQAGIYCSENCKCVECKNFEDAGSTVGAPGGGAKRVRPNSAPPPPIQNPLGLAAAAQSVALSALRPGLMPAGTLGALVQQHHGVGGLPAGLASAVAAAAAAGGGGARPGVVGSLAGLGPGGMASLPQALSLALAAASGPQLMSLQSAAAAAGASLGQPPAGPPVIAAPAAQQPATAALPPPLPLRAKMQEVVNGMVKRSVIEELCRLLWMVADDEAAPARGTTAGSAPAGSSSRNGMAGGHGGSHPDGVQVGDGGAVAAAAVSRPAGNGTASSLATSHIHEPSGAQNEGTTAAAGGGGDGGSGAARIPGFEAKIEAEAAEGRPLGYLRSLGETGLGPGIANSSGAGGLDGVAAVNGDRRTAAGGDGASAVGATGCGTCPAGQQGLRTGDGQGSEPQEGQQPRRPGPLYGRKERVVLEEFLSIMNKISETAAKKLQQHGAAPPPPAHLQPPQQSYAYAQGVPIVLPPGATSAGPSAQQQQPLPAGPSPAASYTNLIRPVGHSGAVAVVAPPGYANGQVIYPLGSYPAAAGSGPPQQPAPYGAAAGAATPPEGGVFVVSPAMGIAVGAGPQPSQQQLSQPAPEQEHLQQQGQPQPHFYQPLHANVPIILAPPRGSQGTGGPAAASQSFFAVQQQQQQHLSETQQQPCSQQQPPMPAFGGEHQAPQQQAASGPYATPFLPYSSGLPVPMSTDGASSHQQPTPPQDQQQGDAQAAALLQGIMAASEQQLAIWTAVSERQALLQPPIFSQAPPAADHGQMASGVGGAGCSLSGPVTAPAGEANPRGVDGPAALDGTSTDAMDTTVL